MGLLNNKQAKEMKKAEKLQRIMEKYHLEELDQKYSEAVKDINTELLGTNLMEFGTALTAKSEDITKLAYLNTLIQQNWVIIRLLDDINKRLDK